MNSTKNHYGAIKKDGRKISIPSKSLLLLIGTPLRDISTEELADIVEILERKAKEGLEVKYSSLNSNIEEYYNIGYIYGEEVLQSTGYYIYKEELERRNSK